MIIVNKSGLNEIYIVLFMCVVLCNFSKIKLFIKNGEAITVLVFVCIILVLLLMFKIYKDGSHLTLQKIVGGSEVHLDKYEDLFYRLISGNSSLNSTILDKVISRLFFWPQSTLSSMNTTDIKHFLDQKVNTSNHNKVNTLFSDTFTNFFFSFLQNTNFSFVLSRLSKIRRKKASSVMIEYREYICYVSEKVILFLNNKFKFSSTYKA